MAIYGYIAAEQNNERNDFDVNMSVNFKSTTVSCVPVKFVLNVHESRILSGKCIEA